MKFVIEAKNYEVRCERTIAIETTRKLVKELTMQATQNFTIESQLLRDQYQKVIDQTDYYENTIKKLTNQLSLQELII